MGRDADESRDEQRLVVEAQRDPRHFGVLYERNFDLVYAFVARRVPSRLEAEDITATVFYKALANLAGFEWRGVPYSAWLYRVAANLVARDRRRPGWIELNPQLGDDAPGPEDAAVWGDRAAEVRAAVATLPADQRQAVLLRFGGELRNREIAEIMGRSEGAVKLLTFRALTTLRRRLGAPLPAERAGRRSREGGGDR